MPSCLIRTCPTIGDNIYIQKLLKILIKHDFEVFCPLFHRNAWLEDYIKYDGLNYNYSNCDVEIEIANSIEENWPYDIMSSKFKAPKLSKYPFAQEILDLDDKDWQQYVRIVRNYKKEEELFARLGKEPYCLVSPFYGTNEFNDITSSQVDKNLKTIILQQIDSYTLFDWLKLIQEAEELIMVDSAICYLIEVFEIKAKVLKVYPRHSEHTFKALNHIFNRKNWGWL